MEGGRGVLNQGYLSPEVSDYGTLIEMTADAGLLVHMGIGAPQDGVSGAVVPPPGGGGGEEQNVLGENVTGGEGGDGTDGTDGGDGTGGDQGGVAGGNASGGGGSGGGSGGGAGGGAGGSLPFSGFAAAAVGAIGAGLSAAGVGLREYLKRTGPRGRDRS